MLSTLISLYKLLGTGEFVKVLLILTGGLFFCLLTLLS